MGKTIINSIVVVAMILCITAVSLELDNTIVLGWYIVPGFIQLVNVFASLDDGTVDGRDEYGV